jgi:hypothetical protein
VFVGFFFYGNIGESIMKLGEFYELYGVRWVCGDGCTAIYGASKMHKMSGYSEALHVHVLGGACALCSPSWDCVILGLGMSGGSICKGVAPCMFLGLECALFGVNHCNFGLCKAFYV